MEKEQRRKFQRIWATALLLIGGFLISSSLGGAPLFTIFGITISALIAGIVIFFFGFIYFFDIDFN